MPNAFEHLKNYSYIDLVTYRKSGAPVHTPVWFAEQDGKLYVMTRNDSGKAKRIRNNPRIEIAPSTIRGNRTGPGLAATVQVAADPEMARRLIRKKYLLARFPIWSRQNIYLEIRAAEAASPDA
jgi:PPOX class probable F420-dependent enzyme